jgi:hypothetical protein
MKAEGTLRVNGEGFCVELSGDAEFVGAAWEALKPVVIARAHAGEKSRVATLDAVGDGSQRGYVWVLVLHELYRKVHVQERPVLARSALARHVDVGRLSRVYLSRSDSEVVGELFSFGRTAWSELTSSGQRQLGGDE